MGEVTPLIAAACGGGDAINKSYSSRSCDDGDGHSTHHPVERELERHLSLFDLVCIGIGATVGSGVFVLVGLIAHTQAGAGVWISWSVAGVAACLSAVCYAELGSRFPKEGGSSYVYARETMGHAAAVIAGACLTLEYTGSASAVARSWGDKVVSYVSSISGDGEASYLIAILDPGYGINPCAFAVSLGAVMLLLGGVKESKWVANIFSTFNVCLVAFMALMSLSLAKPENLKPVVAEKFGPGGILRGSMSSFFGYIGFDEICCCSGEAINPTRDIPRSIIITLALVTTLYIGCSVGLAGMVPYEFISETSGFPEGFRYLGHNLAANFTAIGELIVLPLVVLVTILAQPRLNYTLALDGILPRNFAEMDDKGNLIRGIKCSGFVLVAVATFIPFRYLDDLISSGILIAFTLTDTSVILVRQESPKDNPRLLKTLLVAFHSLSFVSGFFVKTMLSESETRSGQRVITIALSVAVVMVGNKIRQCPRKIDDERKNIFIVPCAPIIPLCGCFINLYLIAQLEFRGLIAIASYIAAALLFDSYNLQRRRQSRAEP